MLICISFHRLGSISDRHGCRVLTPNSGNHQLNAFDSEVYYWTSNLCSECAAESFAMKGAAKRLSAPSACNGGLRAVSK